MSEFVLFGVVYDATTGEELRKVEARPEYTKQYRRPDVGLLARLNAEAEVLASRQARIARLEAGATPFDAKASPPMVHPEVDEDETPWDRAVVRMRRDMTRPRDFDEFARQAQARADHFRMVREAGAMFDMPSVDPEDTRSPEPYDVHYETTLAGAFVPDVKVHVGLFAFVYAAAACGLWSLAAWGASQATFTHWRIGKGKRRTYMVDAETVPLYFGEDDGPHVTEHERGRDLDVLEWLLRSDREVERASRRRQEDASGEVARIGIPGVAAPLNRALFDYERLLSNRDAPVRLAVVNGKKKWVVQSRAFPGEQNIMLALEQRKAAGEKHVPDPHKWVAANRSRFNVRRYIDAIASAFADDPNASFEEVDAIKKALLQRGVAKRAATWSEVEAWAAREWKLFSERCFLACVGEEVSDGAWMTPEHSETDEDDNALSYEDLHGMHGVHIDRGHAVYQVDLVAATPRRLVGGSRTPYIPEPRPTHVRPTRASERGSFTMDEVVKGLLATVRRMEPLKEIPTISEHKLLSEPLWRTPVYGTPPREARGKRFWNQVEAYKPSLNVNSRAQVRARLVAAHA